MIGAPGRYIDGPVGAHHSPCAACR